ncbi:HsdM family class I SAM-dependent methyltransferase [Photobacterium damselae]
MAKRHVVNSNLLSKIRRCQEIIMARSGADDLYEIIKIIYLKKYFSESFCYKEMNNFLLDNSDLVEKFVDGDIQLIIDEMLFIDCWNILDGEDVDNLDYYTFDVVFEELTSHKYKSNKGQYFTPRNIVNFCVESLNIEKGSRVCDPACGSSAFLKSAFDYLNGSVDLYGFDISPRAIKVSNLMSYLLCESSIYLNQRDSLDTSFGNEKYDVILTNPPFAGDVTNSNYVENFILSRGRKGKIERDVLFLEMCVNLLNDNGKLAIVLPDNKVSSVRFSYVRDWLIKNINVRAVVSLNSNTFKPYTSQKAVVIFAQKEQCENNKVSFYISDQSGKNSSGDFFVKDGVIQDDLTPIKDDIKLLWNS